MSKRIPLTKGQYAIVDDEDYERVTAYKWCYHPKGYAVTTTRTNGQQKTMYLHRFITGITRTVDHRNLNKLDCRKENLRAANPAQNMANCDKRKHNRSGFKGVYRHSKNDSWIAAIGYKGEHLYIGSYVNPIDAAKAYDEAARRYYGDYARTNF